VYAIIKSGGRQLKVAPGDIVTLDRIEVEPGTEVTSDQVLLLGRDDGEVTAGTPFVEGARIVATVLDEVKGPKIRIFKKKRRKGSRHTQGHRAAYTRVQVKEILA
jgi:large subunit ribosomal protein L21